MISDERVAIHIEMAGKLNFACHQSAFPLLRSLRIENRDTEHRLDEVTVTLSADPDFLKPKTWKLDRIAPGGTLGVPDRDIDLDGRMLLDLADTMRGHVNVQVSQGETILAEASQPVELLAYNEWGGTAYMPELLAAFAVPNDPAVDRILRDASLVLRRAGKTDTIEGYQSGSRKRVWEIVSAIYTAIANFGLSYAVPPASFERNGQKVRLPGQILEGKVGTCLDTTLLFASALEQAGLNPLVVMPEGHAFVGVWLQPEDLANIVTDEAEILRKRVKLQDLLLVETTEVTAAPALPLSKATKAAERYIADPEQDAEFVAAVDIQRARAHRITPLGLKTASSRADGDTAAEPVAVEQSLEEAPALPDFDEDTQDAAPRTPEGRLERWQRKLLDLSARNPLLNHKTTKLSLPILCPEPGKLEDKLAEGARISIRALRGPADKGQDANLHAQRTGEVISEAYAREVLDKKEVLVDLPEGDLSKRAVEIYRKAQVSLQEGGANTLYLALGFLLWKREETDTKRFRAPLILLPVSLERKSVRSGVKIVKHDDEPRFNTTLLQMLRQDFAIDIGGLDGALPEDESGVDVDGIWNKLRKAVKDAPGFEVVEDVVLGHFSFAKYLMWKDLADRTDELRNNAVVQHLIDTPREPYGSEIAFVDGNEIDAAYTPADLLAPLPADSSQMAAVATAERGKDFIVVGPPGTGKSQTIGNLIAHKLGKGRSVLFVSEKTAALEVVYRRLREIGLSHFCLQLHSNKANKAEVLGQLREAWDASETQAADDWQREADRLRNLRDKLNAVVQHLHKRHSNGLTPHEAIGVKIRDAELAARVDLSWPRADQHDKATLEAMRETVDALEVQAKAVGNISDTPFRVVGAGDWSPTWENRLAERASALSRAARDLDAAATALCQALDIHPPDRGLARLETLNDLARLLLDSYRQDSAFALETNGADRVEALEQAVTHLRAYADAQARLSCAYEPMAWRHLDGDALGAEWAQALDAWWPKRVFAKRAVIKTLRAGGARGKPDPARDAPALAELRREGEAIDSLGRTLDGLRDWAQQDTDPATVATLQTLGARLQAVVGRLADDPQSYAESRRKLRTLLRDANDLLAPEAAVGRAADGLRGAMRDYEAARDAFDEVAEGAIGERATEATDAMAAIRETADTIANRHRELNKWCGWRNRRTQAMDHDLRPLVEGIERGDVPPDEIVDTFRAAYCGWWSSKAIEENEVLRTFSSPEHMDTIERFQHAVDRYQDVTARYIAARLASGLPARDGVKRSSQWGLLGREIQKKAKHKPVRQLVNEIPEVLTSLAPCLMMSPLSVAQYLPANQDLFDVVIFDEASQIPVWDAVGAIARGRQVIVAGDPKQMPPSNFFGRQDDDADDDVDTEGDLESILDEMLGASIPERRLNLHYRSRRESLIAFSNNRYYDSSLITFPAPVHPDHGVRLIRPEGHYARGKGRHNEGEARAIVAEIVRRLTAEDDAPREGSMGVVTFNAEQQTLIENLLDEERAKRPEIEPYFSFDSVAEPVFVKNLETVQGDERDVILFSVTYGPDESGHVTMNFGPLNRQGGERRLNVALTRARSEMIVFSTLAADRIDLSRTQASAVADLKHFLEFAERGPSALAAAVHGSVGDYESPFETAVARALRERGWDVHSQIGVSRFRIDLGVVHPDRPGVYLAGVECDGAKYHSSAFARERDKIRQSVLEGLGWTIVRVWSTDWWINKGSALDDLDAGLRAALDTDRERRASSEEPPETPTEPPDALAATAASDTGDTAPSDPPAATDGFAEDAATYDPGAEPVMQAPGAMSAPSPSGISNDGAAEPAPTSLAPASPADANGPDREYRFADPTGAGLSPDAAAFHDPAYEATLARIVDHVIDREGPIHDDILVRRVARAHGFQRAGRQIRERVLTIARDRRGATEEDVGTFLWPHGSAEAAGTPARTDGRDEELRKPDRIAAEELRRIARERGLHNDADALGRALGLRRLTQTARGRLQAVLDAGEA